MNTEQLARETWLKLEACMTPQEEQDAIRAAIEKVDEQWRERFRKFEKIEEKFGPASQRAAHPSEV